MSADNWTNCPKCKIKHDSDSEAEKLELGKAYGKIPSDEYLSRFNEFKSPKPLDDTLREDYEIGIFKGKFSVDYSARCSVCGFKKSFKHEEEIK